jgi:hypothetical protein
MSVTCPVLSEMLSVSVVVGTHLFPHYPRSHLSRRLLDRDLQQISQADIRRSSSARIRSMTMLVTSAPSSVGSTCTLNGSSSRSGSPV